MSPIRKFAGLRGPAPFRPYVVPAVIGILVALVGLGGTRGRVLLEYRREALAHGELWRLITGHLVHLGASHMLMNLAALAVLAFVLSPYLKPRDWLAAGLFSAFAIDAGLYWLDPAVDWYVGLSGVLHGYWAAAVASAVLARRWDAVPLAALLLGKLAYEAFAGPVPLTESVAAGPVVTQAHLWGALGGAAWPLSAFAIRGLKRSL